MTVYPTIDAAIRDRLRLRFGPVGDALTPLLIAMFRPRLGFSAGELRPIDAVAGLRMPKPFLYGLADRQTLPEEARDLYRRASDPKESWEIPGARHEDLEAFAGAEYRDRVLAFLNHDLTGQSH